MIQLEKVPTVQTNNDSLPVLTLSEDGQAFATFPEFSFVFHPEYLLNAGFDVLDRSSGALCIKNENVVIPTNTFPNGSLAFDNGQLTIDTANTTAKINSPNPVDTSEFSVIFASNITYSGNGTAALSLTGIPANARVLISTSRVVGLYDSNGGYLLAPSAVTSGVTETYIITYSDGNGGKIYKNGELVSSNEVDLVRTVDSASFPALYSAFNFMVNATSALTGPEYVTGIDLSKPEHAAKRVAISNYMIQTYIN